MNTSKSLSAKFETESAAQSWADKKVKSGKWVSPKIVAHKEQVTGGAFVDMFTAYVYNPSPVLSPYTGKAIGNNINAK